MAAGQRSEILISFFPLPWVPERVSWMARVTAFVCNSRFLEEQVRGPFSRFRHRHGFLAEVRDGVEGTLVTDEIEYALACGFIGRIGGALVRRKLAQSFAYRQKRLPQIL